MTQQQKSKQSIYIIIILLLASTGGYLFWRVQQLQTEVGALITERGDLATQKEALDTELHDMLDKYDVLETENEDIQQQIEEQKERIAALQKQAKKHKNDAYIIHKLRKEATSLREIMKGFVHTIDSLNTLNQNLVAEKAEIKQQLGKQEQINQRLSNDKKELIEQVEKGSRLQALDMVSHAQRVKANNIHRETTRAKRAEKIKTCFTLSRNEIAKSGPRDVYIRIIDPDGKVLCLSEDKSSMFEYNGVKGLYSVKKQVDYKNEEVDVCIYWDVLKELVPGNYIVEAYSGGLDIGTTFFSLK